VGGRGVEGTDLGTTRRVIARIVPPTAYDAYPPPPLVNSPRSMGPAGKISNQILGEDRIGETLALRRRQGSSLQRTAYIADSETGVPRTVALMDGALAVLMRPRS